MDIIKQVGNEKVLKVCFLSLFGLGTWGSSVRPMVLSCRKVHIQVPDSKERKRKKLVGVSRISAAVVWHVKWQPKLFLIARSQFCKSFCIICLLPLWWESRRAPGSIGSNTNHWCESYFSLVVSNCNFLFAPFSNVPWLLPHPIHFPFF